MKGLIRDEGFWVFREGSGGDGVFHTTREAAEEEAERLAGDLAAFVVPAVRFTSKGIERQRTEGDRTDTAASSGGVRCVGATRKSDHRSFREG
jgi:hypothetical protein